MNLNLIISLTLASLSLGCTNETLSNETAEALIQEYFEFPRVEAKKMYFKMIVTDIHNSEYVKDGRGIYTDFTPLIDGNVFYAETKEISYRSLGRHVTSEQITYSLTDYGYGLNIYGNLSNNKYGGEWMTCLRSFEGITGILMNAAGTSATVEYTTKRIKQTPFYRFAEYDTETFNESLTISKYEDGWRIDPSTEKPGVKPLFHFGNRMSEAFGVEYVEPKKNGQYK